MKKTYIINGYKYKFEEGTQPKEAIEFVSKKVEPKKEENKVEPKKDTEDKIEVKVSVPKNKSKGVKAK